MIRDILVVLTLAQIASAAITFDSLTSDNGTDYVGHDEGAFVVQVVDGSFYEAQFWGNPPASIFGTGVSSLRITRPVGLLFTFSSLDVSSNVFAEADFGFKGFLQDQELFHFSDRVTQPSMFTNIVNPYAQVLIDELIVHVSPNRATSFNIDNIATNAVPEPGAFVLFGSGVVALAVRWRTKARCGYSKRARAGITCSRSISQLTGCLKLRVGSRHIFHSILWCTVYGASAAERGTASNPSKAPKSAPWPLTGERRGLVGK